MPSNLPLELNTVYFPQIGFLVSITRDEGAGMVTWEGDGDAHWEKMFTTESTSYYKTDEMREMDERFGDVVSNIYGKLCSILLPASSLTKKTEKSSWSMSSRRKC